MLTVNGLLRHPNSVFWRKNLLASSARVHPLTLVTGMHDA